MPGLTKIQLKVEAGNREHFELWRWTVAPMFTMDARDPAGRETFGLSAHGYYFDGVPISVSDAAPMRLARGRHSLARFGMDSYLVQFHEIEDYLVVADGQDQPVRVGDIAVFDMTREFTLLSGHYRVTSIILPRPMLAPLLANPDAAALTVIRREAALNRLLRGHMQGMLEAAPELSQGHGAPLARAAVELTAACVGAAAQREQTRHAVAAALLMRMRRHIADALTNPALDAAYLARQFGVSRTRLYRLFEPLGGVQAYIRGQRLMRAHAEIIDPGHFNETIGQIAARYGYEEKSAFSRDHKRLFGVSPSESRAIAMSAPEQTQASADAGGFRHVNRWLLGVDSAG